MVFTKGRGFLVVVDYRTANALVQVAPWPMLELKVMNVGDVAAHSMAVLLTGDEVVQRNSS